jgi:hypothetical protein
MSVICVHFDKNSNLLLSGSGVCNHCFFSFFLLFFFDTCIMLQDHKLRCWNLITGECDSWDTGSAIYAIGTNTKHVVHANRNGSITVWDKKQWTPMYTIK